MSRCPECAGKMEFNYINKHMVCKSCGLSLTRHDLDQYWKKIRDQNIAEDDDMQRKKSRRKEWLDWYSKSKDEKSQY